MLLIVGQSCCPGDIYVHSGRRRSSTNDVADGIDRFIGQCLTLVSGQVQLDVGRFAVAALRTRRGEGVTPEVLDVGDVLGICAEVVDEVRVEAVRLVAERLVGLEHDHRRTVRIGFLEDLPDMFHGLGRGGVGRAQRHRLFLPHFFQRRDRNSQYRRQGHPRQHNREREHPDQSRDRRVLDGMLAGHADFTMQ
ncbi:hypothetical protein FHT40_004064 [Mycolicibacterium sp. BK556]|nr:hypothetical protein [Mycolicibacterium sp. BK556]MBB3634901.1 hypothetical protein [Mycolicibacterium sp. BK607]